MPPKRGRKRRDDGEHEACTDVASCLSIIGTNASELKQCDSLEQEWSFIKKRYFKLVLKTHPDKGGDAAAFREVQSAFQVLRAMVEEGRITSFIDSISESTSSAYNANMSGMPKGFTPSWNYYAEASESTVPSYRVEPAKSGRSKCSQKTQSRKRCAPGEELIGKGEIRVGSMDDNAGTYGRWCHLSCWRVPSRIWLGFPEKITAATVNAALLSMNEVQFCGFDALTPKDREAFVAHVMDKTTWARLTKRKALGATNPAAQALTNGGAAGGNSKDALAIKAEAGTASLSSSAMVAVSDSSALAATGGSASNGRERFQVPSPGRDGAIASCLGGKTFVLTGVFPEIGGGTGLNLGKDKMKALISSFGGKVTSSISGKTDVLVVGKTPGYSKVSKARERGIRLMNIEEVRSIVYKPDGIDMSPAIPLVIDEFSQGYNRGGSYNGLAQSASSAALSVASGRAAPPNPHRNALGAKNAARVEALAGVLGLSRSSKSKSSKSKSKKASKARASGMV